MYSISALVKSNDREQILHYLADIMEDFEQRNTMHPPETSSLTVLLTLNFQDAERRNITTTLDLNIPENLEIPSIDMTIILGNLLDNAIEAASEVKESPYIDVKIKYDKGRLFLQVKNPYVGEVIEKDGRFITTKNDRENHGIGLDSVAKVVLKYDGTMSVDYIDNIFSVAVLMYVD